MEASQARSGITESQIKVREVTHYQFSWTAAGSGEPGTFTLQLILDQGAAEAVLALAVDDADVLKDLLHTEERTYYDLEREVLMFGVNTPG